jgi:plasmid maintenance system antidote protein VapI
VLVLSDELEQRITAAARIMRMHPDEFIVGAVQRRCAEVLEPRKAPSARGLAAAATTPKPNESPATASDAAEGWAIRPSQTGVLRALAQATGLSVEALVGSGRDRSQSQARAVAAYLLIYDAGLSVLEAARVLHRDRSTVCRLVASVANLAGTDDPRMRLVERARVQFRNGSNSGKHYMQPPPGRSDVRFLPGLLAYRLAAGLSQPEVAKRAGIARETLARLERLQRGARAETVEALARAFDVSPGSLTMSAEEVPALYRPAAPRR